MNIAAQPLSQWAGVAGKPLIIAGPCAAETEEQLLETAERVAAQGVGYLRAGIWKARTRPNSFEGIGEPALPWLRAAGIRSGLRTATEVATPGHVEAALRHQIDLLWIGARTTVNPFSVQELAAALRGTTVPILIKNPTNPDLALWLGAVERVYSAGVRALGVIHRGFSIGGQTRFRNAPMWDLVIEMRRTLPGGPILCDPSHITGRRDLVPEVAQRAMDLGLDGLMIEAHRSPDEAWSDAGQQVTPERLGEILRQLHIRVPETDDARFNARLGELRHEIDEVDQEILEVLARRMRIVEQMAECKLASSVTTFQVARWKALLDDRMSRAAHLRLDADYVKALYEVIHGESLRCQSEITSASRSVEPAASPPD